MAEKKGPFLWISLVKYLKMALDFSAINKNFSFLSFLEKFQNHDQVKARIFSKMWLILKSE